MADLVDHFAALGFERSAAVDADQVKERFHELSRDVHPDAEGGDEKKFAVINEAQRVLTSPATRLRHLLELEYGNSSAGGSSGTMSEVLMDLFTRISEVMSKADVLIGKRQAATSAVAKALLAGEEMETQQALMGVGGDLMARRRVVEDGLGELEVSDREALEAASHELAFLEKWQRQVQERMGALV